jgi:hypothetical protein
VWIFVNDGYGHCEEEADDHGSPKVPFAEVVDALFAMFGEHEEDVAYFPPEGDELLQLVK